MGTYTVFVDDNFHHADESERIKVGEFQTCEAAIAKCKQIVDEFFSDAKSSSSWEKLYEAYCTYGDDPFIVCGDNSCSFSARDYAKRRCQEICSQK